MKFLQDPGLNARCFDLFILCSAYDPYEGTFATAAIPVCRRLMRIAIFRNVDEGLSFPVAIYFALRTVFFFFFPVIGDSSRGSLNYIEHPFARGPAVIDAVRTRVRMSKYGVERN